MEDNFLSFQQQIEKYSMCVLLGSGFPSTLPLRLGTQ